MFLQRKKLKRIQHLQLHGGHGYFDLEENLDGSDCLWLNFKRFLLLFILYGSVFLFIWLDLRCVCFLANTSLVVGLLSLAMIPLLLWFLLQCRLKLRLLRLIVRYLLSLGLYIKWFVFHFKLLLPFIKFLTWCCYRGCFNSFLLFLSISLNHYFIPLFDDFF